MEAVISKCGKDSDKVDKMEWVLAMINDAVLSKIVGAGELSQAALTGRGRGNGNKGFIDVCLFLRDLRRHLLGDVLESSAMALDVKETLREKLRSPKSYRVGSGGSYMENGTVVNASLEEAQKTDISWMSTLGSAGRELYNFCEAGLGERAVLV